MESEFSQQWRKRQSCLRCRRLKVRCEYRTPISEICKRCTQAGEECLIQSVPGATSTTTNEAPSKGGAKARIAYLQKYIAEAYNEIDAIAAANPELHAAPVAPDLVGVINKLPEEEKDATQEIFCHFSVNADTDHGLVISTKHLRDDDAVNSALEVGLYTEREVLEYYRFFIAEMIENVPCKIKYEEDLLEMRKKKPLLALAMITAAATHRTLEKAAMRRIFFERIITEQTTMMMQLSLTLVQALYVEAIFLSTNRSYLWMNWMYGICITMDMANGKDLEKIRTLRKEDPLRIEAMDRVDTFLSLVCVLACIGSIAARRRCLSMLNGWQVIAHTLKQYGQDEYFRHKQFIVYIETAFEVRTAVERMTAIPRYAITEVVEIYNRLVAKLTQMEKDLIEHNGEIPGVHLNWQSLLLSNFKTVKSELAEYVLHRYVVSGYKVKNETRGGWVMPTLKTFVDEIYYYSMALIDEFVELGQDVKLAPLIPKYVMYWPIMGLVALMRIKSIRQAIGVSEDSSDDKNIMKQFDRITKVWREGKRCSWPQYETYPFLTKMKAWYLKTQETKKFGKTRKRQHDPADDDRMVTNVGKKGYTKKAHNPSTTPILQTTGRKQMEQRSTTSGGYFPSEGAPEMAVRRAQRDGARRLEPLTLNSSGSSFLLALGGKSMSDSTLEGYAALGDFALGAGPSYAPFLLERDLEIDELIRELTDARSVEAIPL